MRRHRDRLGQLLALGRMGGPARERVLERVMASLREPPPAVARRRHPFPLMLGALAGLAAAITLFVAVGHRSEQEHGMRGKGTSAVGASAPSVTASCPRPEPVCRPGDRLLFQVAASPRRYWMTAWADPLDREGAAAASDRIWIFPTGSGESPEVPATSTPLVLRRAVEIDSSFAAGHYRLTLILSDRLLTRDQAMRPPADAVRLASTLVVVE